MTTSKAREQKRARRSRRNHGPRSMAHALIKNSGKQPRTLAEGLVLYYEIVDREYLRLSAPKRALGHGDCRKELAQAERRAMNGFKAKYPWLIPALRRLAQAQRQVDEEAEFKRLVALARERLEEGE